MNNKFIFNAKLSNLTEMINSMKELNLENNKLNDLESSLLSIKEYIDLELSKGISNEEEIYLDGINKLNEIMKNSESIKLYFSIKQKINNIKETIINDENIDEIVSNLIEIYPTLHNKEIENKEECLKDYFNVVYNVIKHEFVLINNSQLYDYFNHYEIAKIYLGLCIKNDILSNNYDNEINHLFRELQSNNQGFISYYNEVLLLKLSSHLQKISIEENNNNQSLITKNQNEIDSLQEKINKLKNKKVFNTDIIASIASFVLSLTLFASYLSPIYFSVKNLPNIRNRKYTEEVTFVDTLGNNSVETEEIRMSYNKGIELIGTNSSYQDTIIYMYTPWQKGETEYKRMVFKVNTKDLNNKSIEEILNMNLIDYIDLNKPTVEVSNNPGELYSENLFKVGKLDKYFTLDELEENKEKLIVESIVLGLQVSIILIYLDALIRKYRDTFTTNILDHVSTSFTDIIDEVKIFGVFEKDMKAQHTIELTEKRIKYLEGEREKLELNLNNNEEKRLILEK